MQHERAQSILSGQSNLARRVFDVVPKQDYWSVMQISNELHRKEPHGLTKGEITGCLRTLVEAGLVSEAGVLTFRSTVKPPKPVLKEVTPVTAPALKVKPKQSLMEQLFDLATSLRTVAEKVEAIGMEVDSTILEAGKGDERLRQLQTTLRGLMSEA